MPSPAAPRVLLTGFEPFDGATSNPSATAVGAAATLLREQGVPTRALVLPVEFGRAGDVLAEAVRAERPAVVLATGLAAGRRGITPERVAINVRDARIPDGAGAQPVDEPVVSGGPVAYFSSLPIKALVAAATELGVPASVSQTAGTYVCNDVFYRLMHVLTTDPALDGVRGGFVHVPGEDVVGPAEQARTVAAMALTALGTSEDLRRPGGAIS